jgi:hypothetical protein
MPGGGRAPDRHVDVEPQPAGGEIAPPQEAPYFAEVQSVARRTHHQLPLRLAHLGAERLAETFQRDALHAHSIADPSHRTYPQRRRDVVSCHLEMRISQSDAIVERDPAVAIDTRSIGGDE